MSTTIKPESRKVRKPKIEKYRRARINSSLESLKEILLRNTISIPQGSRPTKLEKADILEMTVRYVEMLHEKLYCLSEKPARKPIDESSRRKFSDISNQTVKRQVPTLISEDSKAFLDNHFRMYRQHSSSANKENSFNKIKDGNHLELSEQCWRPWTSSRFENFIGDHGGEHRQQRL